MKIRPAVSEDLALIRQLFYDTVTALDPKDYSPEQITEWASVSRNIGNWSKMIKEQYFLVAEAEGKIVGFGSMTNGGNIDVLYVDKGFQSQGVGAQLLAALEKKAMSLALQEIWTDASITAKPFFQRKGFVITRTYQKTLNGIVFENSIMTKQLG